MAMGSDAPENSQVTDVRRITCTEIDKAPTTVRSEVKDNCRYLSLNQIFRLELMLSAQAKSAVTLSETLRSAS